MGSPLRFILIFYSLSKEGDRSSQTYSLNAARGLSGPKKALCAFRDSQKAS
jgi:hypothetical protein